MLYRGGARAVRIRCDAEDEVKLRLFPGFLHVSEYARGMRVRSDEYGAFEAISIYLVRHG
jgi:hypothetical protein